MNLENYSMVKKNIVRYEYLNFQGTLFGGIMASWIDESSAIYAMEVMGTKRIVTVRIGEIIYKEPVKLGDIIEFCCKSSKIGNTSLTVNVRVRRILEQEIKNVCNAEVTFVAVNEEGRPEPWNKSNIE